MWDNFVIEALTGAFSGVVCALVAAFLLFAVKKGKRFDFWILIAGAIFGVFWAAFNANAYFTWPEWFLTIVVLTLFGYVAPFVNQKMKERISVNKENVLMWTVIVGCIVFVEWSIIALFMWFLPFAFDPTRFMVWEWDKWVFHWFATGLPESEIDAFVAYLIFALPAFCVIVGSALWFTTSSFIQKRRHVQ